MATPIPENRARFSLDEVLAATGGTLVRRGLGEGTGAVTDSRTAKKGAIFVALRGEKHDAHAFVPDVVAKGAAIVVLERGRSAAAGEGAASVVEVDDTLVAWGRLAGTHLDRWRALGEGRRVLAITGSAGKTTTKELAAALLGAIAPTHFTAGNLNNRIGVPSVIFALEPAHRFLVLEMGMSLPGELDAITAFARPDASIVTNVGVAHAEGVGGRDGVMREKGAVYRALAEDGIAVVNVDDPFVVRAAEATRARRVETFGRAEGARYRLLSREGTRVTIARPAGGLSVALPIPGEAAAVDLAAALAAAETLTGAVPSAEEVTAALARVRLEGRGHLRKLERDVLVLDDTYNANPASMRAALETLREVGAGRRLVAVLGEMKELGALAEGEHDALGEAVAASGVALAIGCGGLATRALERAKAKGVEVVTAGSTEEAAAEAARRIRGGDAVLVKGSRSVGAERVVAAIVASYPEVLPLSSKSALSEGR